MVIISLFKSNGLLTQILKPYPFVFSLVCLLFAIKNCTRQVDRGQEYSHSIPRHPLKYFARIERVCVTLSYSRWRRMSAVRSGSAQYKRWHTLIIKAYAETLDAQTTCYTQHIYSFLAPSLYPSNAALFHVHLKTGATQNLDTF